MELKPDIHLNSIKPYFNAFEKSHLTNGLKQREVAEHCNIRASTLSVLFTFFRGKGDCNMSAGALISVLNKLKTGCEIKGGILMLTGHPVKRKADKYVITPYENYYHAKIGQAVLEGGEDVYMLNTYVSHRILEEVNAKGDEGTLRNWIERQKKKVRLLVLRPDGKAMRLRTKADLGNSTSLTNRIMEGLESALKLQQQYPEQLEIRLMDELPGLTCVMLNDRLFFGLHYSFDHAENGPVFEINDPSHFTYGYIRKHFDTFWNSAERSQKLDETLFTQIKHAVQVVYSKLDYLLGEWEVFIHNLQDVYNGEGPAPDKLLTGGIEKFNLYIEKDYRDIYPRAVITLPNLERLTGSLVVEHLQDRDYAHVRLTDHTRLSIHLTVHCRFEGKKMYGCFTMSSGSDCCTGVVNLVKKEQGAPLLPAYISEGWKRQLAFCEGAFISLGKVRTNIATFDGPFKYAGVYKVYSYGGNSGDTKHIKINWLHINEWGEARYKNHHYNSKTPSGVLLGKATEIHKNTHISFALLGSQERRSYLIIHTNGFSSTSGRYYSAVHLGVSWDNQMPNGKRFLLEQVDLDFDEVEPQVMDLHSEEYKSITEPIRKLLSGRMKNLVGFLRTGSQISNIKDIEREWKHSIKMSEVFFDAACMIAKRAQKKEDYEEAVTMLFRALNHGFGELDRFEKELEDLNPDAMEKILEIENYKKIQAVLKL